METHLRRADLVEYDEDERLHEPSEDEVRLPTSEQQARPAREGHLRDEARQGRPQKPLPRGRFGHRRIGRVGEIDQVEVGREVVSMVQPVQVIQVAFFEKWLAPSAATDQA